MTLSRWAQAIHLLALLKLLGGGSGVLAALLGGPLASDRGSVAVYSLFLLAFGGTSLFLIFGGGRDRRAVYLGGVFLLGASSFSDLPIVGLAQTLPGLAPALAVLKHLQVDAFLPYFFWEFVRHFPRILPYGFASRAMSWARWTALTTGMVLFVVNGMLYGTQLLGKDTGLGLAQK